MTEEELLAIYGQKTSEKQFQKEKVDISKKSQENLKRFLRRLGRKETK